MNALALDLVYAIDNLNSGGAQRQIVELAVALNARPGVRVRTLIYRESDFFAERLTEARIPVLFVPKRRRFDPGLPVRIGRVLRHDPPQLIHSFLSLPSLWSYLGIRSSRLASRPRLILAERSTLRAPTFRDNAIKRFLYPRVDGVTANSECVAQAIHAKLGVPSERIHYLPNGINLPEWDAAMGAELPFAMDPGCFQLAVVGGLRREKNQQLVVQALRRVPREILARWRVWFVGSDRDEPDFADEVRQAIAAADLGGIVRIVPPTREIAAVMARLDGLILPSLWEGFPNAALEAMASRVPVLANAVGDIPNMIDDGRSGAVLAQLDPESLADALVKLHGLAASARRALGENARRAVEARFSMPIVAERYLDLYRRVVAGPA